HFPVHRFEGPNRRLERVFDLLGGQRLVGGLARIRNVFRGAAEGGGRLLRSELTLAPLLDAEAPGYRVKPGRDRRAAPKILHVSRYAEQGILQHVFRVFRIAAHLHAEAINLALMTLEQPLQGFRLARTRSFEQFRVVLGHGTHLRHNPSFGQRRTSGSLSGRWSLAGNEPFCDRLALIPRRRKSSCLVQVIQDSARDHVGYPFSLVGILPAHGLLGAFFSATSMIGFIAGAGIVVRNSIILVDFVEQRLAEGAALEEAVVDAGAIRFRPMLLTAAAVVVGAAVILFDPIFQGLAISLMAGEV